jgi:2-polyprenyl-6-hydroxyphenyl methylase/3-demethylubiquinone-9 3-methyltransferase
MDYYHDVHDWMGGWPYESRKPGEILAKMQALGFAPVRVFARRGRLLGRDPGIFGSGCDEFVFRRS